MLILHKLFGSIKILSDQLKGSQKNYAFLRKNTLFLLEVTVFYYLGESIDYVESQYLITSVIEQLQNDRNETSFKIIYCDILDFAKKYGIDMNRKSKHRRPNVIPTRFKDAFITSTMGHRQEIINEVDYLNNIYYPLIDAILVEMRDRFSPSNIALLSSVSSISPQSKHFLNYDLLLPLASHINCDQNHLFNEIQVMKPMLESKKLSSITELYHEIMPLQQAFPNIISMIKAALTIPVSSSTCERVFSKMKLIKTRIRTTMADERLSDLCILSIERDFQN